MKDPCISIIIPVYNGSDFLREAIDSALSQTYRNFEVIVVNDGSSDAGETARIAASYGDRIRYCEKENGGVATALNLGLKEMRGDYFSWLSHDDFYYPDKLRAQIDALKSCGDMERIVISDYDILEQASGKISHYHMRDLYEEERIENSVFSILQGLVSGCSMLIHKSHFQRAGVFDEDRRTTQDYDLWFRMFRGQRLLYVPQCLMAVRSHANQGSQTIACHSSERSRLYIDFVNTLTEKEILSMYPSKSIFYAQLLSLLRGGNSVEAYRHINTLFLKEPIAADTSIRLAEFSENLTNLCGGKARERCIFCAGNWGRRLLYELQCRLVHVDYFCDNNPARHGTLVDGIPCISLQELSARKEQTQVIVSTMRPDPVTEQLRKLCFPFVTTRQELSQWLFHTPRIRWMTAMDSLEEDLKGDTGAMLDVFRQTVFEICTYYEKKLSGRDDI